jgi:hypothetical protein
MECYNLLASVNNNSNKNKNNFVSDDEDDMMMMMMKCLKEPYWARTPKERQYKSTGIWHYMYQKL